MTQEKLTEELDWSKVYIDFTKDTVLYNGKVYSLKRFKDEVLLSSV